MISKTFAVLIIAKQTVDDKVPVLQLGIDLIYAPTTAEAQLDSHRSALKVFPENEGWANHQVVLKDVAVHAPPTLKGGYLHIYAIFATKLGDTDARDIKLGMSHEVTSSVTPDSEADVLATLFTICPEKEGWTNHSISTFTKPVMFVFEEDKSRVN